MTKEQFIKDFITGTLGNKAQYAGYYILGSGDMEYLMYSSSATDVPGMVIARDIKGNIYVPQNSSFQSRNEVTCYLTGLSYHIVDFNRLHSTVNLLAPTKLLDSITKNGNKLVLIDFNGYKYTTATAFELSKEASRHPGPLSYSDYINCNHNKGLNYLQSVQGNPTTVEQARATMLPEQKEDAIIYRELIFIPIKETPTGWDKLLNNEAFNSPMPEAYGLTKNYYDRYLAKEYPEMEAAVLLFNKRKKEHENRVKNLECKTNAYKTIRNNYIRPEKAIYVEDQLYIGGTTRFINPYLSGDETIETISLDWCKVIPFGRRPDGPIDVWNR